LIKQDADPPTNNRNITTQEDLEMANRSAQRVRAAELDGAIRSAAQGVGTRSIGIWIPIFIGWILGPNG
jgi:hypothetical protein